MSSSVIVSPPMSTSSSYANIDNAPTASTSTLSLASASASANDTADQENVTSKPKRASPKKEGKRKSEDDHSALLPALVVSSQMTATSLAIADIQARIFSIQELRHKSQESGDTTGTTNTIDQSLMALDEKLESLARDMKAIGDAMEPLMQESQTPTFAPDGAASETAMMLRKHATLVADWESVQDESDTLREELKEDKWLTVFRTVTDQADGMMSSLEKAVNRCQEFISSVYRHSTEDAFSHGNSASPNVDLFNSLLDSFEAKKKHYMPATSKVLSIIDKGVRDRVTKNGETLRRHAESAQRWRNLRERITRIDADMEAVRKYLLTGDTPSENGSSNSGTASTHNGYLVTPPNGTRTSRAPSSASTTLSRSISPFRKLARKIKGTTRQSLAPVTPLSVNKRNGARTPSSEPAPAMRKQRASLFNTMRPQPTTPTTPDRPGHKHSYSAVLDTSPRSASRLDSSSKRGPAKIPWNSSTKVELDGTLKGTPSKRSPSAAGMYGDVPPPVPGRRSISRASMTSSRPFSPMTSTTSFSSSHHAPPMPSFRPPSRAQTPSRSFAPGSAPPTPRARPRTPSHIPAPTQKLFMPSAGDDDEEYSTLMQRAFSPTFSTSGASASGSGILAHPPRPPSRSMIPVPTVHLSSPSRPSTSMSTYGRSESPTMAFRMSAARAQTPESTLRTRAQQVPVYQSATLGRASGRPSLQKLPPSSFRDGNSRTPSRPGSRNGAYTPLEYPQHEYTPGNPKDPLDVEVAAVVNSIAHGFLVERIDPPLKKLPKDGEEIKAQYAFSNQLSKKVVTCRLTTMTRISKDATTTTKKVMCRVGGGWQDLNMFILNRQAGM